MDRGAGRKATGAPTGRTTEWDSRAGVEAPADVPKGVDEEAVCRHAG